MYAGEVALSNGRVFKLERVDTTTRTASAKVHGDTIVIKIPRILRGEAATTMFTRLKERIVASIEKNPEKFIEHNLSFHDSEEVAIAGRKFVIKVVADEARAYSSARISGDAVVVRLSNKIERGMAENIITKLVVKALSRELIADLERRIEVFNSAYFRSNITKVRIRDNTSRWGSYSRKSRSISINFRLLYAPANIVDYVIVHELCHSKIANHSARFWLLVSSILPDYKDRRRWLRKNGDLLGMPDAAQASRSNNSDAAAS